MAARGKAAYMRAGCWQCHGASAAGGASQGPKLAPEVMAEIYAAQVRRPVGKMPPYRAAVLSDQALEDIPI